MVDESLLKIRVQGLLSFAVARKTKQGIIVYEAVLKKLNEPLNELEKEKLLEPFKKALTGMEAHGHFTNEEFEVVTAIRNM